MFGSTRLCAYLPVLVRSPLLPHCSTGPIVYHRPKGAVHEPLACAPTRPCNEHSSDEAVTPLYNCQTYLLLTCPSARPRTIVIRPPFYESITYILPSYTACAQHRASRVIPDVPDPFRFTSRILWLNSFKAHIGSLRVRRLGHLNVEKIKSLDP